VAFSLIGFIVPVGLIFAATPVIVRALGDAAYGVQALLTNIVGYLSLFNTAQAASTKYMAEYLSVGDHDSVQNLIGTSLLFNVCVGLVGAGLIFGFAHTLASHVFVIPPALLSSSVVAFRLAGIGFLVSALGWSGSSLLAGLQRFDWLTVTTAAATMVGVAGSVAAALLGWGLIGVVAANLLSALAALGLYAGVLWRLLPAVRWRLSFDRTMLRRVALFGAFTTAQVAFGTIAVQLDRTLLGIWIGVVAVTTYAIPLSIAARVHQLCAKTLEVVMPASSALDAHRQQDRLRTLFLRAQNLNVVIVVMLCVPLLVLAREILALWISPSFADQATYVFQLLVGAYGLLALSVVLGSMAAGLGQPHVNTAFAVLLGVANLAGYCVFIPRWGVNGAGIASLFGSVVSVPMLFWYVNRRLLRIRLAEVLGQSVVKPVLAGLVVGVGVMLVRPTIHSLLSLILVLGLACGAYVAFATMIGTWQPQELRILRDSWRRWRKMSAERP
jgi:O-antigen/teichoic acid export membrane protein